MSKITIFVIQRAKASFVKDLKNNGIKYTSPKPNRFTVDDTPKVRMAMRMAKENHGQKAVAIRESLTSAITEGFGPLNEAKEPYAYLKHTRFSYRGNDYFINKIERYSDDKIVIDTSDGKSFNLVTLLDAGTWFAPPPKKELPWNHKDKLMSAKDYQSTVKDAAKTGGAENASDLAQNMILDKTLYARLVKDNGKQSFSNLVQRLQWDIEAHA